MIRLAWIGAHADVTQKRQCVLAGVSRTTVYVKRKPVVFVESDEVLKRLIDEEYSWKKLFRNQGFVVPAKSSRPDDWDSKAKLAAIIETAAMNESQRSEYCRQHGLYPEQLDAWKVAFESLEADSEPASKADLAQQRKKLKQLEKEILRKDKALAEAAALLVLSKKAQAIWGTKEED